MNYSYILYGYTKLLCENGYLLRSLGAMESYRKLLMAREDSKY